MKPKYKSLEAAIAAGELSKWEQAVAQAIKEVPSGRLTSYGCIAEIVNRRLNRHGRPPSRAVAMVRMKLYGLLGHKTKLPLHRVATQGCMNSENDSDETKRENAKRRKTEGTPNTWEEAYWCFDS